MLAQGSLPCQPLACKHTHTNNYVTWKNANAQQFIRQFLSIFTLVIFAQNTINYIWIKKKKNSSFDVPNGFRTKGRNVKEVVKRCVIGNLNFIVIMLFPVLEQVLIIAC